MNMGVLKSITGGDKVMVRCLYQEPYEFSPRFKLFLATNKLPKMDASDAAIWRRVRLIPFNVVIPSEERIPNLADVLLEECDGILRWIIEGAVAWNKSGLQPPESVLAATADYRSELDEVGAFLEQTCELTSGGRVGASVIYDSYRVWCRAEGLQPMRQQAFARELTKKGYEAQKIGGIGYRLGLRLSVQKDWEASR
jgi:putative DNA primase/helicase